MAGGKMIKTTNEPEIKNNLQCIKNLLILQLIKDGAAADEISIALKAGAVNPSNIRIAFPMRRIKRKNDNNK